MKEKLLSNLIKNKLDYDLKSGFINLKKITDTFSLRDGNIRYTILYLKSEKSLKVFAVYGNYYSCEIINIKFENLNNELKNKISGVKE